MSFAGKARIMEKRKNQDTCIGRCRWKTWVIKYKKYNSGDRMIDFAVAIPNFVDTLHNTNQSPE